VFEAVAVGKEDGFPFLVPEGNDIELAQRNAARLVEARQRAAADELGRRWNALSAEHRLQVQQQFMAYRGSGRMGYGMGRGMGPGRGMGRGMGGGMGGCWW